MLAILERLICYAVAAICFYLGYQCLKRNRPTWTLSLCLPLGCIAILCSMSWFQGLFKSQVMSAMYSTVDKFGEKIDAFQKTTGRMQSELGEHQSKIDKQYQQMSNLQIQLEVSQQKVNAQQKKIEDVEYLVDNLYSKTTHEIILGTDTNRVLIMRELGDNVKDVLFKLANCPIRNSIQGVFAIHEGIPRQYPMYPDMGLWRNVCGARFQILNLKNMSFTFTYVKDTRSTNRFDKMEIRGTNIFFDGILKY